MSDSQDRELVILIHGTGSPEPDAANPLWWQHESAFAKDLRARLGPGFDVAETPDSAPFSWSGRNSERDRRSGGRALLRRVRQLEAKGRPYHLVGHSHGGSVIWHMLSRATAHGIKLDGLRSWTTVGTPFLEFAPLWHGLLNFAALALFLVIVGVFGAAAWSQDLSQDIQWRDVGATGKWLFFAQCALIAIAALYLTMTSVRWAVRWIGYTWRRMSERLAARRYRDRWLGLWHRYDEPINGLSGSLVAPIWFAPRWSTPQSPWLWRVISWPYDRLLAPTADQFVWTLTMSRLQGGDIFGLVMVDAAPAPRALTPGWPQLVDAIADDMAKSAGNRAVTTANDMRRVLSKLRSTGEGRDAVQQLASAISWSEILHTCYLDHTSVRELIASEIALKGRKAKADTSLSANAKWLMEPHRLQIEKPARAFRPLQLALARVVVILALAALLGTGLGATYVAYFRDHSSNYQIGELARETTSGGEFTKGTAISLVGDVLARLEAIAKLGNPRDVFSHIKDANTRVMAAQRLGYALGHAGRFEELDRLIEDVGVAESRDGIADLNLAASAIRVHALAGALAGGQKDIKDTLLEQTIAGLGQLKNSQVVQADMFKLVSISLEPLAAFGKREAAAGYSSELVAFLDGLSKTNCDEFNRWLTLVHADVTAKLAAAKDTCDRMFIGRLPPKSENLLDPLVRDRAFKDAASLVTRHVPEAQGQPDTTNELVDRPWRLIGYAQFLLAGGEEAAANRIANYFLKINTDPTAWSTTSALETIIAAHTLGQLCSRLGRRSDAITFAGTMEDTPVASPDAALRYTVGAIVFHEVQSTDAAKRTMQKAFDSVSRYENANDRLAIALFLERLSRQIDTYVLARQALRGVLDEGYSKLPENPSPDDLLNTAKSSATEGKFRIARRAAELAGEPTRGRPGAPGRGGVLEGYVAILDRFIALRHADPARAFGVDPASRVAWPILVEIHNTRTLREFKPKID